MNRRIFNTTTKTFLNRASSTHIPKFMRSIEIDEHSENRKDPRGCMTLSESARVPALQNPDEILIKVQYAGVNMPDVAQRKGFYPAPKGAPQTMGLEVSGEVVSSNSDFFSEGDRVGALVIGGGYAEYCIAKASHTVFVSETSTDEDKMIRAATFPETFFTVWSNLFWSEGPGRMQFEDETLLIHGGSGGIGTMAIQIASQLASCRVVATAGSDEKCDLCSELGAYRAVNYNREDFAQVVQDEIGGVDVILDVVGGSYISKHLQIMNRGGRHISIGFLQGSKVKDVSSIVHLVEYHMPIYIYNNALWSSNTHTHTQLNLLNLLAKGITLTGSTLRRRPDNIKASILDDALHRLTSPSLPRKERLRHLLEICQPHVTRIYDLEDAAEAHACMESREHLGKIALRVS